MLQKIAGYMQAHHMIDEGAHVIVGVSGGADSVCLLLVLLELQEQFGYTLSVVHVEHGIRGSESQNDAVFVQRLCEEKKVFCRLFSYRVPEYAREHGMSEEEAGRKLRYEAFEEEKRRIEKEKPDGQVRIAVAHHLGDNGETMLFHLARGTGIRGLSGIAPVRGSVIRPLLVLDRAEIEAFLRSHGQEYCEDATNEELEYSRNRIRHSVMPQLAQVNSRALWHMSETAEELRGIAAYLEQQAANAAKKCVIKKDGQAGNQTVLIMKEAYGQVDAVLRPRILGQLFEQVAGSRKDLTREHIHMVEELFHRQSGKCVSLPYGLQARRRYEGVEIVRAAVDKQTDARRGGGKPIQYVELSDIAAGCGGVVEYLPFQFELIENGGNFSELLAEISKKKYTKCFDYDKIRNSLCIRSRLPGDYLVINDAGDRQKLKKYLVNEKIPSDLRENIDLLADGEHILWVAGYRMSSDYKISTQTKRILKVTFYGGKEDE